MNAALHPATGGAGAAGIAADRRGRTADGAAGQTEGAGRHAADCHRERKQQRLQAYDIGRGQSDNASEPAGSIHEF